MELHALLTRLLLPAGDGGLEEDGRVVHDALAHVREVDPVVLDQHRRLDRDVERHRHL